VSIRCNGWPMTNLTELEFNKLNTSKTALEWDATCDEIKAARGGRYPPDWWQRILAPGVPGKVAATWNPPQHGGIYVNGKPVT